MLSQVLYYSNTSYLPYVACPKLLKISGFNFVFNEQQTLCQINVFLNRLHVSDDITSLLMINSNGNQVQDILSDSKLLIKSRFILDSFDSVTMELPEGTHFIELVPLCEQSDPNTYILALPTYTFFEIFPTHSQYKTSRNFVLTSSDLLSPKFDYMGTSLLSYVSQESIATDPTIKFLDSFYTIEMNTQPQSLVDNSLDSAKPLHIIYVAGGSFDGMKQIMMSPWKHFSNQNHTQVKFTLIWVCHDHLNKENVCESLDSTVKTILKESPYVSLVYFPPISIANAAFDEK